ncbi:hypothetical protein KOR34_15240 [Posidoniimonas corsicana]|uniref:Polymerase nucleotidyl transferase domain-containing protein n=1 Tax=Posidoniimonas corsicana TaxID=1938618 RepID=A0A5C5VDE8_9BACT|nr:hypothetical protein [Posidoniimonas corsicana]TWT36618.1 hypothetical protein KOR34_15240 [Posidoniimonas corsicana]
MVLQKQADVILQDTGIVEILRSFGTSFLHGSYDLDLMVWPELDIAVEIPELDHHTPYELMAALSRVVTPTVAMVVDQFGQESLFPMRVDDSILVDFRFIHAGVEWKLDLTLLAEHGEWSASVYNNQIKQRLTPETRRIIASIKDLAVQSGCYRRSRWAFTAAEDAFCTHDIYKAVFECGVTNYEQFASYLKLERDIDLVGENSPGDEDPPIWSNFSIIT